MERELDALCRRLVVELRDRNTCQRCGKRAEQSKIDWSHVVTRGAKSIRWSEFNSKALCAGCHQWWGSHPLEAGRWLEEKWPQRALALAVWRHEKRRPKIDRGLIRLHLLQRIRELEGGVP
jgi:hypothetical protein